MRVATITSCGACLRFSRDILSKSPDFYDPIGRGFVYSTDLETK